jgi:hypothetical protein
MRIADYLAVKLKEDGYDGLCGAECGCGLDDFMPCLEPYADCMPAYRVICAEDCPRFYSEHCEGHIGQPCYQTTKPEPQP